MTRTLSWPGASRRDESDLPRAQAGRACGGGQGKPFRLLALGLTVLASACAQAPRLPQDHLGRWYAVSAGGGLDGSTRDVTSGAWIVIRAENVIESYAPDGTLVATESFTLSRGGSIFGDESWLLDAEGPLQRVILLHDADTLTIADNAYDGHGVTYRRSRPSGEEGG